MGNPRILLIDDDQMILEMLKLAFSSVEMEVLTASHGDLGLRVFHDEKPDLAIVDIAMPGIDGYDVVERMRAADEGKDMPIIILTAHGQPVMRTYAEELGADMYLTKPISPKDLISYVQQLLEGKK